MTDRLLYKTQVVDGDSGLPVYVFDTSFVPSSILKNECDESQMAKFTSDLWRNLPDQSDYCLAFFTTAFSRYDTSKGLQIKLPMNFVKFFQSIPPAKRDHALKLYVVHGNWFTKSFIELFKTIWHFGKEIVHCENLAALADNLDITGIPVSLMTYMVDRSVYGSKSLPTPRDAPQIFGTPCIPENELAFKQFSRIYDNIMAYLKTPKLNFDLTKDEWQMVMRINYLDDETHLTVSILSNCIKRNQRVFLSDFSFLEHYIVLMKFIYKMNASQDPLIPAQILTIDPVFDFDDVDSLDGMLNDILIFKHPKRVNGNLVNGQYDNAYVIIKTFKFFHALMLKLHNEIQQLGSVHRNMKRSRDRQTLRLILAYTKVLYNESGDDDETAFDNLFKFISGVLNHYDEMKVFGTDYNVEAFNDYITLPDYIAFESFKTNILEMPSKQDEEETAEETQPAEEEEIKIYEDTTIAEPDPVSSQTGPDQLAQDIGSLELEMPKVRSPKRRPQTSKRRPRPLSMAIKQNIIEEEHPEWEKARESLRRCTHLLEKENVSDEPAVPSKPSCIVNGNLVRYTAKDIQVQQEREQREQKRSQRNVSIRGRKVSELAHIYELHNDFI